MTTPHQFLRGTGGRLARHLSAAFGLLLALCSLTAAPAPKRSYDVPASDAVVALRAFAAQSGQEIIYPAESVRGIRTNAVRGELTAREALDRLVAGTALTVAASRSGALAVNRGSDPKAREVASTPAPGGHLADASAGTAGTAPAPTTPGGRPGPGVGAGSTAGGEGETIELSPFLVSADKDVGYVATNTLAGSRMNTELRDTAATIGVLTSEFLADVGATSLTEALEWGNNVQLSMSDEGAVGASPNDNGFFNPSPRFRVRGILATVTRNYFEWDLPLDTYNVERIEEARGPNSILFGIGSAGGVINSSTKQAVTGRSFRRAEVATGSFGGYRGSFDVNQTTWNGRLAVRVNALHDHAGSFRTHAETNRRRVHVAAKLNLSESTRLRFEYETGDNRDVIAGSAMLDSLSPWLRAGRPTYATNVAANAAVGVARYAATARITYIGNNGMLINMANRNLGANQSLMITDPAIAVPEINAGGPGQQRNSNFNAFSGFVEHRFGPHLFLELAYNHQESKSLAYQSSGATQLTFDPNLTLPTGAANPFGGSLMVDTTWLRRWNIARSDNTRLSLSGERDFGRWGNYRLAGLAEYEFRAARTGPETEVWAGAPFNTGSPEIAANQVFRRNYLTEGVWDTYYANAATTHGLVQGMTDPVTGRVLSSTWVAQNAQQQDDPNYQTTLLLGGQARYWKNRLVFGFGYRHDEREVTDRGTRRNPVTNAYEVDYATATKYSYTGKTRTLGVMAHLTRHVSAFYNRADNFGLPPINLRVLPDSQPPGNPEGSGEDMGFAVTLLDGKLHARAVYYRSGTVGAAGAHGFGSSTTSPGVITTQVLDALVGARLISNAEADARRVDANGVTYDRTSEGYEFSLTANPTKNWRLQVNYSQTSSFEENIGAELAAWAAELLPYLKRFPQTLATANGSTIAGVIANFESAMADQFALNGEDVGGNRKHKVNFFTRYTFSGGPLKGLFVGGGYRHQSKNVAGRDGPQGEFLHGRSYWLADALLGYRFARVRWAERLSLQLNIANLFDETAPLITNLVEGPPRPRRLVPVAPRTWRLAASVEF